MMTKMRCVIGLALMMLVTVILGICGNEKAYADERVSYTVRYIDEEKEDICSPSIGYANLQEEIVVSAKEIEGYVAKQNEQKIKVDNNNLEIVFNYVKEKTVIVDDNTPKVDNKNKINLIKEDHVVNEVEENNKISTSKKVNDKVASTSAIQISKSKGSTTTKKKSSVGIKKEEGIKITSTGKPVENKVENNAVAPTESIVDVEDSEQGVPNYMKPFLGEDTSDNNIKEDKNNSSGLNIVTIVICGFAVVILIVGGIWTVKNRKEIFN